MVVFVLYMVGIQEPWAKFEFGGECNSSKYIIPPYGACDTIVRNAQLKGSAPERSCIEWRDRKDWQVSTKTLMY